MFWSLEPLQVVNMTPTTDLPVKIREVPYNVGKPLFVAPYPGNYSLRLWCEASDGSNVTAESGAVANSVANFEDALGHDQTPK